jgi:hypothetical protein
MSGQPSAALLLEAQLGGGARQHPGKDSVLLLVRHMGNRQSDAVTEGGQALAYRARPERAQHRVSCGGAGGWQVCSCLSLDATDHGHRALLIAM